MTAPDEGVRACSKGAGALRKQPLILDEIWTIIIHMLRINKEKQTSEGHSYSHRGDKILMI